MAQDLQHLIDKIQKEAVDKAESESARIISEAKEKASKMLQNAEAESAAKLEKADKDAEAYASRSAKTIEQAARDAILAVGQGVENLVLKILAQNVDASLTSDFISKLLLTLAQGYIGKAAKISLSEEDSKKLASFVSGEFKKKLGAGVTVESDSAIFAGFRLSFDDGKVSHEFTNTAIVDALSVLLRPKLASAVQQAIKG